MNQGWIKLHRKILEWEWYTDTNTFALFMHLLLTCNFKETKWRGVELDIGETIRGIRSLAEETTLSIQNVRTSIAKLKSTGELTQRQHGKHRILKLKNYKEYQLVNTESNSELTSYQHDTNTRIRKKERKETTTAKNVLKILNLSGKENLIPAVEDLLERYTDKVVRDVASKVATKSVANPDARWTTFVNWCGSEKAKSTTNADIATMTKEEKLAYKKEKYNKL